MKFLACFAFVLLLLEVLPTTYGKGGGRGGGGGRSSSRGSSRGSTSSRGSSGSYSSSSGSSYSNRGSPSSYSGSSGSSYSNRGSPSSYSGSSGSSFSNRGSPSSYSGSNWGSSSNRGYPGSYSGSSWNSPSNVGYPGSYSGSSWNSPPNVGYPSSYSGSSWNSPPNVGYPSSYSGSSWNSPPNVGYPGSYSGSSWNSPSNVRYSGSYSGSSWNSPPNVRYPGSYSGSSWNSPPNVGYPGSYSGSSWGSSSNRHVSTGSRYSPVPPINRGSGSRYSPAPPTSRPRPTLGPRRPTLRGFHSDKSPTIRPSGRPPIRGGNIHNPLQTNGQNRQQYPSPSYPYYPPSFGQPIGAGSTYPKAHKKKGFLNQIFSPRKTTKLHSNKPKKLFGVGHVQPSLGMPSSHAPGMYPFIPVMAVKTVKPSSHSKHLKHWFLPHPKRKRGRKWKSKSIFVVDEDDDYDDSRCFRPNPPENGYSTCTTDTWSTSCEARCNESYRFSDNTTVQKRDCFRMSGVWSPSATFPACEFTCKLKCENGGICKAPGVCICGPGYRGSRCQYNVMKCDIRTLTIANLISWSCSHTQTEATCRVSCKPPRHFASPAAPVYRCNSKGVWTPSVIPECVMADTSTSPST